MSTAKTTSNISQLPEFELGKIMTFLASNQDIGVFVRVSKQFGLIFQNQSTQIHRFVAHNPRIETKVLQQLTNVTELKFTSVGKSLFLFWKFFPHFVPKIPENLPSLTCDFCQDAHIPLLSARLTQLRKLDISESRWITGNTFALLPQTLQELNAASCDIGIEDLNQLKAIPLRRLNLSNNNGMSKLPKATMELPTTLLELDLSHNDLISANFKLQYLSSVHTLILSHCWYPSHWSSLVQFPPKLQVLDLSYGEGNMESCFLRESTPHLRNLNLSHCTYLRELELPDTVQVLNISYCSRIPNKDILQLATKTLRYVNIIGCEVDWITLKLLQSDLTHPWHIDHDTYTQSEQDQAEKIWLEIEEGRLGEDEDDEDYYLPTDYDELMTALPDRTLEIRENEIPENARRRCWTL